MTIGNDGNNYVETLQTQSNDEIKIVIETQSESKFKHDERAIVPQTHSEILLSKPSDDYSYDSVSEKKSNLTMVTTTAKIPGEMALEFDKVVIVALGKVKGKRKETATETVDRPQDVVVRSKAPKTRSIFGRDLQVYCASQPYCMDCCILFEYCCMGPRRNCFIAYVMVYYFFMQAWTSYLMYYLLSRRRSNIQNINSNIMIGSILIMVLINYIMLCLACSNHCLISFVLLVLTVLAYSFLLSAFSIRYDTDLFWFANTSLAVVALFLLVLAFTCYDFTNCRMKSYIVLVSFLAFFLLYYTARDYVRLALFQREYTQKQLLLFTFMTILHGMLLVTTLKKILCCCFVPLSICDYAIAAYILYTMCLQQVLCLVHMGADREC